VRTLCNSDCENTICFYVFLLFEFYGFVRNLCHVVFLIMCFTYLLFYLHHLIYSCVLINILFLVNAGVSNMPGGGTKEEGEQRTSGTSKESLKES
jgi:hypothetical protein